jgi:hypothetical protein
MPDPQRGTLGAQLGEIRRVEVHGLYVYGPIDLTIYI